MTSYVEQLDKAERTIAALRTRLSEAARLNERLTHATVTMTSALNQIRIVAHDETLPATVRLGRIDTQLNRWEQPE